MVSKTVIIRRKVSGRGWGITKEKRLDREMALAETKARILK